MLSIPTTAASISDVHRLRVSTPLPSCLFVAFATLTIATVVLVGATDVEVSDDVVDRDGGVDDVVVEVEVDDGAVTGTDVLVGTFLGTGAVRRTVVVVDALRTVVVGTVRGTVVVVVDGTVVVVGWDVVVVVGIRPSIKVETSSASTMLLGATDSACDVVQCWT